MNETVQNASVSINLNKGAPRHVCVFDNIIAKPFNFIGEGIGIIFKTELVKNGILSWNVEQLKTNSNSDFINNKKTAHNHDNTLIQYNGDINYFSADLGVIFNTKFPNYTNARGGPDTGRPFIMAGGYGDNNELNIFVSFHGVNMVNIKNNGNPIIRRGEDKQIATEYSTMVGSLVETINHLINSALESTTIKQDATSVNIFIGADTNEPEGIFVTKLNANPFKIKVNDKVIEVNFNIDDTILPNTCCANCNSARDEIKQDDKNSPYCKATTGDISDKRYKDLALEGNPEKNTKYQLGFYNPKNFIFKGDYVAFGSSKVVETAGVIEADDKVEDLIYVNKQLLSDHLPAIMKITMKMAGGKRRTRRRRRSSGKRRISRRRRGRRSTRRKR
jgi:hypothetical protein